MTTKYLQHFPKPLLADLLNGRWLPMVGAGMSLNAQVTGGKRMPLWGELGKQLEADLTDNVANGTLDAISAYEHEFGRARLMERLSDILLIREARPGDAHREFCTLPFDIVCTTNFDFLLEKQYGLTPLYVYPLVEEEQLSLADPAGTVLLKLHGDLHHPDRMIVTEADYDGFIATYPLLSTYLASLLISRTAVFIGYSLDDPDFRQIWHLITQRLGRNRRKAYSIMVGAKQSDISRFERRGVTAINLPGSRDRYGEILAQTFAELRDFRRDKIFTVSAVTEEQPLRELTLPRDAANRLCFFSLPLQLLPLYRERIFPYIEELGLVPVTADDVVSPGDSISAKIDALVDRARVMVVELTSAWTFAELKIAMARLKSQSTTARKPFTVLIVTTNVDLIPPDASEIPLILRDDVTGFDRDGFSMRLVSWLAEHVQVDEALSRGEARRLFELKEYRAAVVAAITQVETALRKRLENYEFRVFSTEKFPSKHRRAVTITSMLNAAVDEKIIPEQMKAKILEWMHVRNRAIHDNALVSAKEARNIVWGVEEILALIEAPN